MILFGNALGTFAAGAFVTGALVAGRFLARAVGGDFFRGIVFHAAAETIGVVGS